MFQITNQINKFVPAPSGSSGQASLPLNLILFGYTEKDPATAAPRAPIGGFGYAILADGMALVKAIRNDVQMTHARCAPIAKLQQVICKPGSPQLVNGDTLW